jgi:hypothetical protein
VRSPNPASGAWQQGGEAGGDDDVVVEERPVTHAGAEVPADVAPDRCLKEQELERRCLVEAEVVDGDDAAQRRREVEVRRGGDQVQSGVDEVGLPLVLAAPQIRDQAAAVDQRHPDAGQAQADAVPVAEAAAREGGIVEDRIEAGRLAVGRLAVA